MKSAAVRSDEAAEAEVLAILLKFPARLHDSGVTERHFHMEHHKRILRAFRQQGPSVAVVIEMLGQHLDLLEPITEGGWSDACLVQTLDHLERLAEIREAYMSARGLLAGLEVCDTQEGRDLIQVATGGLARTVRGTGRKLIDCCDAADTLHSPSGERIELTSIKGFIRRSEVIFLAAPTGVGKTSLAQQIVLELTAGHDAVNLFFSMEMTAKELHEKHIQRIYGRRIWDKNQDGTPNPRFSEAADRVQAWHRAQVGKLYIDQRGGVTVDQIRSRVMESEAETGRKVLCVVIDQYDKIQAKKISSDDWRNAKGINVELNSLAKELDVCILCLIQINKKARPDDGWYDSSHIFGTSGPEQDAGQVWILQRYPDAPYDGEEVRCRLLRDKCRGGTPGLPQDLSFHGASSTFREGF